MAFWDNFGTTDTTGFGGDVCAVCASRGGVLYIIMRIKAMHFNINIADGLLGENVIDPMVPDETGLKRKNLYPYIVAIKYFFSLLLTDRSLFHCQLPPPPSLPHIFHIP